MWEEINEKQNTDEMLQLQYYARNAYDNSTRISILKIIVLIINIVLAVINKDTIFLSALFFTIFAFLEILERTFVKNAAKARNLFDEILFKLNITHDDDKKIKEKAYNLCKRRKNDFEIQKRNLGTDNPPGLKNWYTKNSGKNRNEIVFKCQIENTKWDKRVTEIDFIIFIIALLIVFSITIFKYYNKTLSELISGMLSCIELIYEIIKRIYLYYSYNKNLSKRECLIEEFSKSKIQKENLKSLQTLIVKRREMDLVPLNFIHSKISLTMHELISKFN